MREETQPEPNIALSGWSGVGTTTLTLMLALLLKRQYLYIGQVFRYIDSKLSEGNLSLSTEFEQKFQPMIGRTLDTYVDHKLLNDEGIILESDLSSFRIGKHPRVYSIFVKASNEVRNQRTELEGRSGHEESLEERDKALREEYIKLWDVDIFDEDLIFKKYNLIIDNSEMTLEEEVNAILERLQKLPVMKDNYQWGRIYNNIPKYLKLYDKKGKQGLRDELEQKKLILPVEDIMTEIVKLQPEDITAFPASVQRIFLGQD